MVLNDLVHHHLRPRLDQPGHVLVPGNAVADRIEGLGVVEAQVEVIVFGIGDELELEIARSVGLRPGFLLLLGAGAEMQEIEDGLGLQDPDGIVGQGIPALILYRSPDHHRARWGRRHGAVHASSQRPKGDRRLPDPPGGARDHALPYR